MVLGIKKKAQQRRRLKNEIKQNCYLLARQIYKLFDVYPAISVFPEYEGEKIKKYSLTILFQDRGRIKLLTIFYVI